ncbi:MAG: hypothetical protein H7263_02405 [Candidatus Sericytochromatia bacterium]|nr:hypothetical protein [Candidatus Sericytochromatia bacterium]
MARFNANEQLKADKITALRERRDVAAVRALPENVEQRKIEEVERKKIAAAQKLVNDQAQKALKKNIKEQEAREKAATYAAMTIEEKNAYKANEKKKKEDDKIIKDTAALAKKALDTENIEKARRLLALQGG